MIKLMFEGGDEKVGYMIDRQKKLLKFTSSNTNYEWTDLPYQKLFDKGKEKLQEKITDKLSDEDFTKVIILKMKEVGYERIG
jgi:hypothetical protein